MFERLHKIRRALSDDDVGTWKPLLDEHHITAILIEPVGAPQDLRHPLMPAATTGYPSTMTGGSSCSAGRMQTASDVAVFKANQLDPDRVYRDGADDAHGRRSARPDVLDRRGVPEPDGTAPSDREPSAPAWLDRGAMQNQAYLPEPSHCLLAIQEAQSHCPAAPTTGRPSTGSTKRIPT